MTHPCSASHQSNLDGSRKFNLIKVFQSMNYCLTSLAIHPEKMYLEGTLAPDALGL